jgi:PE-PPE domain
MVNAGKKRVRKVAMGVAAVGVATSITGVAATQPASISASLVDLTALIVVGSSTHPTGAGNEDFFQGKFNAQPYTGPDEDDVIHVNFLTGPVGINQALQANRDEPNAVLASGWGAANASFLLMQLDAQDDPILDRTLFILDNNVARPAGGFGTMYPWFALIGVNPFPTPTDTGALAVVDIGYMYDYNSNAPEVLLNPVAHVNSLVAWLYRRLNQAEVDLPVDINGQPIVDCGDANTCAITAAGDELPCENARCPAPEGDRITAYVTTRDNTTYVTYTTDGLPLAQLIRDVVPFGDLIADLTEPLLTEIVNSAYPDNNPIPADPSKHRVATLLPSPDQVITAAQRIPGAIQEGLTAALGGDSATSTVTTETRSIATASDDPPEDKPLTNVVRESEKAVPGQGPEQVGTVENSDNEELTESNETAPNETESNEDISPETDSNESKDSDDDKGAAEAA